MELSNGSLTSFSWPSFEERRFVVSCWTSCDSLSYIVQVWLLSHIPAGFSGRSILPNPSDLLQQIVARYSPHVIVATFNGHTHEDAVFITYAHNGTEKSAATALTANWIGPSLTPLTNLNSAFRMYEVDSGSFEVMESHTWFSNVTTFAALDKQVAVGPTCVFSPLIPL